MGRVAFAQFAPSTVIHNRNVCVAQRGEAERALQSNLPRRRPQKIGATNHVRNALIGVIDYNGELIGAVSVETENHEIADLIGQLQVDLSDHSVGEGHWFVVDQEAPGSCLLWRWWLAAAGTRIDWPFSP